MTSRKNSVIPRRGAVALLLAACVCLSLPLPAGGDVPTPVPQDERGRDDAERSGQHDANNIRTVFWNYGMVGDYPADPGNVDLSVFHSMEVPKGSGMNYSDGVTPFVLAKITQIDGAEAYIMETGFRERQGTSPYYNRVMRFEPRPGYLQPDPNLNPGRSVAMSNDPRTWPDFWPDRLDEADDPGWAGSWNGYFGKQIVADQESYMVLDDDYYDAWNFYPDSRDSTRRGLGLRIEVRGFQWANPQARNVIFWHYDITNEGTTDYDDNIIFGLYMDSGVGGSAFSCDQIYESDDDNAFFTRDFDGQPIDLVYTWDNNGHGRDLSGCNDTGYLGYAYMETPGNPSDGLDNDEDGITDERRDGGPGSLITGAENIRFHVESNYDMERFVNTFGPLEEMPAFLAGVWWTGDEDMDWVEENHDLGADGLEDTGDTGEGDGIPTPGEPNFDDTDLNESDQIGLTGFKMNRISPGYGNPNQETDNIVFFTGNEDWPERLYGQFTAENPEDRFDPALGSNYNIGFLFASGTFRLAAGQTERFSLALAYGADEDELKITTQTVQQIYDANYRFAVPPRTPVVSAEAGDGFVRLSWDDLAPDSTDPVTGEQDFEGYRVYRSTDPDFRDPQVISNGTGSGPLGNGAPLAQFDLDDEYSGYSDLMIEGVAYYLGTNTGLTHTFTDSTAVNGQQYYYAVTAYDYGSEDFNFYPSENAITPTRTIRGGLVLPPNVVAVRPNPRVAGFVRASADTTERVSGQGSGTVAVDVVNSNLVPDGHTFQVRFHTPEPDTSVIATTYSLFNVTADSVVFENGSDFDGMGVGSVGSGLLPIVMGPSAVTVDTERSGFDATSTTDATFHVNYEPGGLSPNRLRPGYPDDIIIYFYDSIVDTALAANPFVPAIPTKFEVVAQTPDGEERLDFLFNDLDGDNTISRPQELITVVTYLEDDPDTPQPTWVVQLPEVPQNPPTQGDAWELHLNRPFGGDDVFQFTTRGQYIDADAAAGGFNPYVVPNPYMGSASFEPERYAVSGRGERRIEFRGLPARCEIRIYNLMGELVKTLQHDGSNDGFVAWDLRTKDQLDVAPGLYIFHVDGGSAGTATGKFAIVK